VRLGVTTREAPERERVVHLSKDAAEQVHRLEEALQLVLDKVRTNGSNDVHLAALARLADRLMGMEVSTPSAESKRREPNE